MRGASVVECGLRWVRRRARRRSALELYAEDALVRPANMDLSNSDLEAILEVHEAWIAAELRGDPDGVLALCTDDVRWLAPNSRVVEGKGAARRLLRDTAVALESIETIELRVEGAHTLAYKTCRYETRFRAESRYGWRVARGTHLWILRRIGSGWKVALVTWQSEAKAVR